MMKLVAIALPSLLIGGLLFGPALGRADDGSAKPMVPMPPTPPTKPTPPTPPAKPTPPTPPTKAGGGVSVSIHDGKVEIDGIEDLVNGEIDSALKSLPKDLPADVRAKLEQRLAKVRATVDKRLGNMKITDLDKLGDELDKMGEDIGKEMEGFGSDMDKWGNKFGKDFGKRFGKNFAMHWKGGWKGHDRDDDDDDDDNDVPSVPDIDDQDDLDDAVHDLGDLSLKPPQRDAIAKLRTDSDKQVAAAKHQLDMASDTLHKQLDNPATSDADIAKSIDAVTQQEAAIRKARILAWHGARRVLDDAQRKKVQDAAKHK